MAIIVVGGSMRGVGKTALVCGLIAALPELHWTAVKITTHEHGKPEAIWEETEPGQGSDTARYLAAGASRALLVTAPKRDFALLLSKLAAKLGPEANVIFESNQILEHLRPNLCLIVGGSKDEAERKPSFGLAARHADAVVVHEAVDRIAGVDGSSRLVFCLANLEIVSPKMGVGCVSGSTDSFFCGKYHRILTKVTFLTSILSTIHVHSMRRAIALPMIVLFGWLLIAPILAPATESSLPAC